MAASLPLLRLTLTPKPSPHRLPSLPIRRRISAVYTPTPYTDRLISATSYTLPLLNGISYGRFLFTQYPSLASVFSPIFPLLSVYRSVPFASFVAFFGVYLAVARNPSLSRFARFNAMQSLLLPTHSHFSMVSPTAASCLLSTLLSPQHSRRYFRFCPFTALFRLRLLSPSLGFILLLLGTRVCPGLQGLMLCSSVAFVGVYLVVAMNPSLWRFTRFNAMQVYLAVARIPSLSRFARFNAMQALMLDVGLVLPQLLIRIIGNPGRPGGVVYKLMVMGHNAVFVFLVMCFVYSFISSLLGKTPYLPLVAEAAGRQLPQ